MTTIFRIFRAFDVLAVLWCLYWTFADGNAVYPICAAADLLCAIWMTYMIRESKRMDAEEKRLDAEWRAVVERWSR